MLTILGPPNASSTHIIRLANRVWKTEKEGGRPMAVLVEGLSVVIRMDAIKEPHTRFRAKRC
jgi:hypothetical protein